MEHFTILLIVQPSYSVYLIVIEQYIQSLSPCGGVGGKPRPECVRPLKNNKNPNMISARIKLFNSRPSKRSASNQGGDLLFLKRGGPHEATPPSSGSDPIKSRPHKEQRGPHVSHRPAGTSLFHTTSLTTYPVHISYGPPPPKALLTPALCSPKILG